MKITIKYETHVRYIFKCFVRFLNGAVRKYSCLIMDCSADAFYIKRYVCAVGRWVLVGICVSWWVQLSEVLG